MIENIKTENSKISSYRQPSYSNKQISHSQIFDVTQSKKSIYLRDSYNQIKLPHFQTQIDLKSDQYIMPEKSNILLSGKPYITKAMEHQYLRIHCQNEIGPMSCQILSTSEFQLMISQTHPFPTNYNCDQLVNNRGFVVSVITSEFIFISIITRRDAEVRFNIQFQQIFEENLRIKTLQDTPRQELSKSNNSKSLQQIVITNKEMAGIKKNKYQDEISRQERFLKVLSTRNFQRESKNQAKVQQKFELTARKLANKQKILIRIINDRRCTRTIFEQQWALLLFLIKMGQKIECLYNHKKKIIQQHRLASFKIKFHLKKLRNTLQREKGDCLPTRALYESFQAIKVKTKLIRGFVRKLQVEKILPILQQRAILYQIKVKLLEKASKIQIIKKHVLLFEENYFKYKNEMITKWDLLNDRIKSEEINEKQQNLRNKAFVTWFHVLKDKEFAQQMRRCFIFELMRDRIRQHYEDQYVIKKYKSDLKYYKQKLRICREPSEANALRMEIFQLTNDIYAMHMKNQLFIHCDVEKYFHRLVSKYIVLIDEPDNLPVGFDVQQKQKQRQSRISLRRGMRKSKL